MPASAPQTSFTFVLNPEQREILELLLRDGNYRPKEVPYTIVAVEAPSWKCNVNLYTSGKCLVQGKGAQDFVLNILEPMVLGAAAVGYEDVLDPAQLQPHMGIDESGKGDFFGPLVIAGVGVTPESGAKLRELGVCDSKKISSDKRIFELAEAIRQHAGAANCTVVTFKMETYNRLYAQFGNLNRLLAWGHARVIENLLEANPSLPRMLSDQFADPSLIRRALMEKGRTIRLDQRTKAESDIAVAAASILARERFCLALRQLEEETGCPLPRGAGPAVKTAAAAILEKSGVNGLRRCCKTHFKTFEEVLNGD